MKKLLIFIVLLLVAGVGTLAYLAHEVAPVQEQKTIDVDMAKFIRTP